MEQQAIITVKDLRTYFYSDKRLSLITHLTLPTTPYV